MKKLVFVLMISVICVTLASCGSAQRKKNVRGGLVWSNAAAEKMNWDVAKEYCEELNEDGISGWRLPTPQEFRMIYSDNSHSCVLDGNTDRFWTIEEITKNRATNFEFSFGHPDAAGKEQELRVRCVKKNDN